MRIDYRKWRVDARPTPDTDYDTGPLLRMQHLALVRGGNGSREASSS
jgi:hypothetical protein